MKLNIGCGERLLDGWINIDKYPSEMGVMFGDIEASIPLPDKCADEILMDNVIEHVHSIPKVMGEAHRLLKTGGILRIITPHYSSSSSWRDPTHLHHLSFFSFDMFCNDRNKHYLGGKLFKIANKQLSFGGGISMLGKMVFLINPSLYEKKVAFIFPASTIRITLEAI